MIVTFAFRAVAAFLILWYVLTETLAAQTVDIGPNLVGNSSFEEAGEKTVAPRHWRAAPEVYRRDDGVARTGRASLRYENDDEQRYVFCVQDQNLVPGCKYRYSVWIKTQGFEGSGHGASICVEWNDKNGKWLGGAYAGIVSGTSNWTRVSGVAVIPKGAVSPRLQLYGREHSMGTAWFDDVELVRVADPALSTILAAPVYRGWITVDERKKVVPRQAIIRARVKLGDYALSPEQVEFRAVLRKTDGETATDRAVLRETRGKPGALIVDGRVVPDAADLKFDTAELVPGRYEVETRLIGPEGKCIGVTREKLVRMEDDFQPASMVDAHRRLLVAGRPFFPLGMYWHVINERDIKRYADSKFNCLMPYSPPSKEQMDLAQKFGLKVIYSVKDWYYDSPGHPKFIKSVADEEPAIRKRVRRFRDHPALLAWYLNDELSQRFLPRLEAHQEIVRDEDPNHPTWAVLYQVHQMGDYRRTFDVIGSDPYPIGRLSGEDAMPSLAGRWTAETSRQLLHARPMWQVPQVFNWANYWKDEERRKSARTPTFEEMRSMAWQCIAEGATGLVFYSWFDIQRNPDVPFDIQWPRMQRIAAEIDRMAPILLSVDPVPVIGQVAPKPPRGVHLLTKGREGKVYLFAVNDGTAESAVEFKVRTSHPIRVIGEARTIEPTAAGFSDRSEKLSVHIYEVQPAAAKGQKGVRSRIGKVGKTP